MPQPSSKTRPLVVALFILAVTVPFCLALWWLIPSLLERFRPQIARYVLEEAPTEEKERVYASLARDMDPLAPGIVDYTLQSLSEEDKQALYDRLAANVGSWHDVLPEPDVGRIAKRNHRFTFKEAEVVTNNAGFRSREPYRAKPQDVFRIVCLGDSVTFGTGGREEDRFCDQLEDFYRQEEVLVDGHRVESYTVAIDSWTAVNEATYLGSRITAYDPDVVLVLTLANDITDTFGVTGAGVTTQEFSPENRHLGTAVFSIWPPGYFGVGGGSGLMTDLGPEPRRRWSKAMSRLKRLEDLQERRGKHTLYAVLAVDSYFDAIYRDYYRRLGFRSPLIFTKFFPSAETKLPHDPHPSRKGHAILTHHFIHALSEAQIVPVPSDRLPPLHDGLSVDFEAAVETDRLDELRQRYVRRHLRTTLRFDALERSDIKSYLGGFFPVDSRRALIAPPFASLRSGFLLRRPDEPASLRLVFEVPPRVELFPFELTVRIHDVRAKVVRLEDLEEAGRHTLVVPIPNLPASEQALEIILETDSYWTTITDPRMKSFYLLSAELVPLSRPASGS